MYTIGKLAKQFGLSRSTLLYYERIDLLKASGRTDGSYRLYNRKDVHRLEQICMFRSFGLPLKEIIRILDSDRNELAKTLESRFSDLNEEIVNLRKQQRLIIGLLQNEDLRADDLIMGRNQWTSLLSASGFSDEDMWRWHAAFEAGDPGKHQQFLEFICIPEDEIKQIRRKSVNYRE